MIIINSLYGNSTIMKQNKVNSTKVEIVNYN